jgi:hypothetical protein
MKKIMSFLLLIVMLFPMHADGQDCIVLARRGVEVEERYTKAWQSDGVDDFISLTSNNPVIYPKGDFTYVSLIRFDSLSANYYNVVIDCDHTNSGVVANRGGWIFELYDDVTDYYRFQGKFDANNAVPTLSFDSTPRNTSQWYWAALTRDTTTGVIKLYVDGVQDGGGTTYTGDIDYDNGSYEDYCVQIGRFSRSGDTDYSSVSVAAFMMWDAVLTDSQISQVCVDDVNAPLGVETSNQIIFVHFEDHEVGNSLDGVSPTNQFNNGSYSCTGNDGANNSGCEVINKL